MNKKTNKKITKKSNNIKTNKTKQKKNVKDNKQKNNKVNKKDNATKIITNKNINIKKDNIVKKNKDIKKIELKDNKKYIEAEKLYKEKKYEETYLIYAELNSLYPKNKKIYKRLIETLTHDFTYKENNKEFKRLYNDYNTVYNLICTNKELKYFNKKQEKYKNIKSTKSGSDFLLIALTGWFGIHKFKEKNYKWGIIYLLTFGLFGIGVIVDLINDYAIYEDDKQLDILRYIIASLVLVFGIINYSKFNFIYFVLVSILLMPICYTKFLKKVPNIIKIIVIIFLCYMGFKTNEVLTILPANITGTWKTNNENTNFKEIIVKNNKSTIKFNDRKEQIGINEYDEEEDILKIYVNATTFYKFKLDKKDNKLCTYNESNSCIISFNK